MDEELKFVLTQKGGQALMHGRFIYYKIRDGVNGRVFWRCTRHSKGCEARLTTLGQSVECQRNEHNHQPDDNYGGNGEVSGPELRFVSG